MRTHRRLNTIILALAFLLLSTFSLFAGTGSTWSLRIEGNDFVITRGGNTSCEETVLYRTVSLSAIAGQHFTDTSGSVTFAPGATTKRITVDLLTPSSDNYKYQVGSTIRSFRFEVTEPGGNILTSIDRNISTGTNVPAGTFGIKDITVDSGTITVKDKNYIQGYHSVPIQTYFNSVSKPYLQFLKATLRMTLTFDAAEEDDGYQHVQILVNYTGNPDEGSGNDNPGTMENSTYMACFVHQGGSTNKTYASYSFPVQSAGDSCGTVATPWSSLGNNIGELRQQYFKSGSRDSDDGRLILPLDLTALRICFDASGKNDDTWYAQNTVAHIQAIDTTAPTRLSDPVVSSGYHAKGNIFYVSIPFSEIVKVTGTPSLSTTWGTLDYCYGSNTNVLTFSGTITADPGIQLKVNSISGTVTDLAGNELTAKTINKTFSSMTVDEAITYTITFNTAGGSYISSQTYTWTTANITLPKPTRTGYRFDGWTGNNGTEAQTTVTVPQHSFGNLTYTANWTDVLGVGAAGADGSQANPYVISNTSGLILLSDSIKSNVFGSYKNKHFSLSTDIDLAGVENQIRIGAPQNPFEGVFNGNGHVILNYSYSNSSNAGLFGGISAGTIRNLIIDGATITGTDDTGILVGYATGSDRYHTRIENCFFFDSTVTGTKTDVGIICGYSNSSVDITNTHYRNVKLNGVVQSDIFTITKDSRLNISTDPAITYQQIAYYPQNTTVTVTSADPDRYTLSSVTVTYGENTIEATKVDDYTFSFTMPSADIDNITAEYTPVNYTITYDFDGGTAYYIDSYNCETPTFILINPTRTGYHFDGWTGSNGDTPETTVTISPGGYGNLTYTAHWTDVWGIERGGDGYALWPYKITTPDGLVLLAECIARDGSYAGKVFVLEADIDMSGISDFGIGTESYPFTGKIDGNNHVIRNLVLGSPTQSPVGLSRYSNKASLMNLIIDGATVKGADNTGIIVGANNDGRISNCYIFNSSIDSANAYGIFSADNSCTLSNSHYRDVTINGADPVSDIFTVTADPALFRVSGTPAVTYNGVAYYTEGSEVTIEYIGYGNDNHLGFYPTFSASAGTVSGNKLTMPAGDVTITPVYTDVWGMNTGANGTRNYPYTITNPEGLVLLAQTVNSGTSFKNKHFSLGNDLDMTGIAFPGIGNGDNPFGGYFHGNYKIIRNLTAGTYMQTDYVGLFGHTQGAEIYQVILDGASIKGKNYVGLIGYMCDSNLYNSMIANSTFRYFNYGNSLFGKTAGQCSSYGNYSIKNSEGNNAYTITAGEGVTVNTEPTFSYGGTDYYADNTSISITVTPKEGYTLEGFSIIPSNSYYSLNNDSFNYSFTINDNCELLAVWTLNEYSIDYDLGGGTADLPTSYTCEDSVIIASIPFRMGYRFLGWTGSNGDTPQTDVTIPNGSTGNRSYTANWQGLWGQENGADGSEDHPYVISTPEGLVYLADTVNSGESCSGIFFVLGNNIDMDTTQFTGIGNQDNPFSGNFDGRRKEIRLLSVGTDYDTDYIGLFGHTENANVGNVIIIGAQVIGNKYVGCLIGYMDGGSATNCLVVGSSSFGRDVNESSPRIGHCSGTVSTEGTHSINSKWGDDDTFAITIIFNAQHFSFISTPAAEYDGVAYYCPGAEVSFTVIDYEGYATEDADYFTEYTDQYFPITKNDNGTFSFTMPNEPIVIYIYANEIRYTIEYNLNGGTADNKTFYTCIYGAFTLKKPTRTGYTFIGWTGSNGDTPQLEVTIPWGSTGNRTYTANWAGLWGQENGADGSEEHPYVISDIAGLVNLSDSLTPETQSFFDGKHFSLVRDLDLTGLNNIRIGDGNTCFFNGVFDGNGHVISNFTFSLNGLHGNSEGAGLFGELYGGTVKNLIMDKANVSGSGIGFVGVITGLLYGYSPDDVYSSIENCFVFNSYVDNGYGNYDILAGDISLDTGTPGSHYRNVKDRWNSVYNDIFTVDADSDIFRISGTKAVRYQGVDYYTEGTEVTVTVLPQEGNTIAGISVKDGSSSIDVTKVDDCTYKFTMPSEDVEVRAVMESEAEFALQNLALGDQIGLRFWMDLSALTDEQKASGVMTFNVKGSPEQTVAFADAETDTFNGVTYPVFRCRLNAVQMADTVTAVFTYQKDGKPVSISKTYSVEEYITAFDEANVTTPFEDKYVDIVHALADYGYYSQLFLSNTRGWTIGEDHAKMNTYYSDLDYHTIAIEQTMTYSAEKTENNDVDIKYALMLDSKTAICVYFIPKNGYSGNISVTVDGSSVEVTQLTASGYEGWYQVKIEGIGPKKLGQEFTVLASTDSGSAQIRLSALSYAYAVLKDDLFSGDYGSEAMEALYRYYLASQEF